MISSLEQQPDFLLGHPDEFETWRTEALEIADGLDPMRRRMTELLRELGKHVSNGFGSVFEA